MRTRMNVRLGKLVIHNLGTLRRWRLCRRHFFLPRIEPSARKKTPCPTAVFEGRPTLTNPLENSQRTPTPSAMVASFFLFSCVITAIKMGTTYLAWRNKSILSKQPTFSYLCCSCGAAFEESLKLFRNVLQWDEAQAYKINKIWLSWEHCDNLLSNVQGNTTGAMCSPVFIVVLNAFSLAYVAWHSKNHLFCIVCLSNCHQENRNARFQHNLLRQFFFPTLYSSAK